MKQQALGFGELGPVEAVAQDGGTEVGQVEAELMGPSRLRPKANPLAAVGLAFEGIACDRPLAAARDNHHSVAASEIGTESDVDDSAGGQAMRRLHDGNVLFENRMALEGRIQILVDRPRSRE